MVAFVPKPKKSKNFDRNLDINLIQKQQQKNVYKQASTDNTIAKQKYIPIATRDTINSARTSKQGDKIINSSLNYKMKNGGTRYNYKKANGSYEVERGVIIPAGKNAGKFEWYDKAAKDNSKNREDNLKKDVLK